MNHDFGLRKNKPNQTQFHPHRLQLLHHIPQLRVMLPYFRNQLHHKTNNQNCDHANNNRNDDLTGFFITWVEPHHRQSKRSYEQESNYNIGCGKVPFCFWPAALVKKLTAKTALYGLVLNLLCAKGALPHKFPWSVLSHGDSFFFDLVELVESDAYLLADPPRLHGYAKQNIGNAHRALGVSDYYKL